ncbi:MAG: PQQ-dependent sugar dehydrogenase [Verrucomicrobiales bacterium]
MRRGLAIVIGWAVTTAVLADRVPWTSGRVRGTPDPPASYVMERVLPRVTLREPVDAMVIPGTDRLAVAELKGRLVTVRWHDETANADDFGDIRDWNPEARECYSIAFHPRFAENRHAFVFIILDGRDKPNRDDGARVVRVRVTAEDPPRLDMAGAEEILTTVSGGHNGGNLRFGPDGYLYLGLGDADVPEPPDPRVTGQDISDLLASVVRIDVDRPSPGRRYGIPDDNPFVGQAGARGEVWAYGFRNPWRLSFSPDGELWVGDVGWELWESVIRVERGGNYGWSLTEGGRQDVRPDRRRGPTPVLPPVHVHSHDEAASLTGGEFSRGERLPELRGAYIYGDWQLGTFWALRRAGDLAWNVTELCRSSLMPVGFALTPDGDVMALDQTGGGLWRLARNPVTGQPGSFPRRLSETGLFADVAALAPASGVVPYVVAAERFVDGAVAARWIAVPRTSVVSAAHESLGVAAAGRWLFPTDTVFAKTLSRGGRRIETQLLHWSGHQWGAYTYRWNEAQADADLVGPRGEDTIIDGQRWRFHSRAECLRCHTLWNNYTPGYSALTLGSQLESLATAGLVPKDAARPATDGATDQERQARDYLHANCATCHRSNGGGSVRLLLEADRPLAETRLLDPPMLGTFGLPEARVVVPGDPARSVLVQRMATEGRGHMPMLGARQVDPPGLILIRDWIAAMPKDSPQAETALARASEQEMLKGLRRGDIEPLDGLLATASGVLDVALALADGSLPDEARGIALAKGAGLTDPLRRDLFERHLPESARRPTLGLTFDRQAVLTRRGDASTGRTVFRSLCATCHRHGGEGGELGPDLTPIGAKYAKGDLLTHIIEPSALVDPAWKLSVIELTDATVQSGFVLTRDDRQVSVRLVDGNRRVFESSTIARISESPLSLMPEALLAGLTADEAAGLLEFLAESR